MFQNLYSFPSQRIVKVVSCKICNWQFFYVISRCHTKTIVVTKTTMLFMTFGTTTKIYFQSLFNNLSKFYIPFWCLFNLIVLLSWAHHQHDKVLWIFNVYLLLFFTTMEGILISTKLWWRYFTMGMNCNLGQSNAICFLGKVCNLIPSLYWRNWLLCWWILDPIWKGSLL